MHLLRSGFSVGGMMRAAMDVAPGFQQLMTGGNSKRVEQQNTSQADVVMFSGCKDQ